MYIWIWKHQFGFDLFVRGYTRRRAGRRRPMQPEVKVRHYFPDITPAEIGQLMGGN